MTKDWYKKQIEHYESGRSYFTPLKIGKGELHFEQEYKLFLNFLHLKKGSKILEIGAGSGRFTNYLIRQGFKVTAVDLSPKILDYIKKGLMTSKLAKNLTLKAANAEKLPFKAETFDACLAVHVLHHTQSPQTVIKEMARVTKRGGQVGFIEPNPYCPYFYFYLPICNTHEWSVEKGMLRSTKPNIFNWLKKAGLIDSNTIPFGFIPSSIMGNNKLLARIELLLGRIPLLSELAGANIFKATKK